VELVAVVLRAVGERTVYGGAPGQQGEYLTYLKIFSNETSVGLRDQYVNKVLQQKKKKNSLA
jgi:hypothetical protein